MKRNHLCKSLQSINRLVTQVINDYPHQSTKSKLWSESAVHGLSRELSWPLVTTSHQPRVRPEAQPTAPAKRCGDETPSLAPTLLLPCP